MTPERLAELQARYDGLTPGAYAAEPPATHVAELLAEVQRLTDELDCAGWSSDRSWSREIDLVQDRDEARTLARTLARAFRTAHHDDEPDDDLSLLLPDWLTEESAS